MKQPKDSTLSRAELTTFLVLISDLKLDPTNPRIHNERQLRQLARSIKTFGFLSPVLIDSLNRVVAGHGRIEAMKLLGHPEVPAIRISHLSQKQLQAYMIADNRLAEHASWDERLLGEHFKALSEVELDFELEATGFEVGEIDILIEGLSPVVESDADPADNLPAVNSVAVAQCGDLWLLERNRLYCGNALTASSYSHLMEATRAAMVFTDPPYNVPISGHATGLGSIRHGNFMMASGEMSESEFTDFLAQVLGLLASYGVGGSLHFICMDWRHLREISTAGRQAYTELKNVVVWVKDNGGMGSFYRSQHELVFVFKHGKESHRNNVQLGQYGRYRTNVWHYPGVNSFSRSTEEGNLLALHPTVKPVALVAAAIMDCTTRGDIVLDPFLGSGTTMIAAERTGRFCYGMELDPLYVDTSIRRWQNYTGLAARHANSGQTFNELEKEKANDL